MELEVICRICSKLKVVKVRAEGYYEWKKGALIQNAMPELSADDRELLISGICGPCFKEIV